MHATPTQTTTARAFGRFPRSTRGPTASTITASATRMDCGQLTVGTAPDDDPDASLPTGYILGAGVLLLAVLVR